MANDTAIATVTFAENHEMRALSIFDSRRNRQEALSMKNAVKIVTILIALPVTSVLAADWPWLYGPRRNHTSEQKGLLRTWPEEGPKALWKTPLAAGFGGPAVLGGNVYLLDRDERVGDTLRGSIWRAARSCGPSPTRLPAASCSPVHARRRRWTAGTSTP